MARMPKLQKHPKTGVWRVRVRVPDALRALIGKREILQSLGTKDRREAERLALPVFQRIDRLFDDARAGHVVSWSESEPTRLEAESYEVLATQFLRDQARIIFPFDAPIGLPPGYDLPTELERFLKRQGIRIPWGSETFKTLLSEIRSELPSGDQGTRRPASHQAQDQSPQPQSGKRGLAISELLKRYLAEAEPSAQTAEEWRTVVRRFRELFGTDIDVRTISSEQVGDFKLALAKLPRKLKRNERKLSFGALIERIDDLDGRERISQETIRKHISCLIAMFTWGVANGHLTVNPAEGLKPRRSRRKKPRLAFDWKEIDTLLRSPVYMGCASEKRRAMPGDRIIKDALYWMPLVLLFSGARLEEIGQANVNDVRCENGIHYLEINDIDDEQRIKTEESRRRVPLHPRLVDVGFLDYVQSVRESGQKKLFPDLRKTVWRGRIKWTAGFSKTMNRYLDAIGLSDRRKVVHSFRHLMKTAMDASNLEDKYQDAILGHASKRGGEWYGEGIPLESLAAAMASVKFPLDISHLKQR